MCGPVYSRPSRAGSGNWISLNRFEYLTPGPALAAPTAVPALAKCGRGLLGFALVVLSAFLSTTKPSRGRRGRRGSGSSCASWRTLSCKARGLLTLPHALRYRLAYDQPLCTAVHRALARALRKRLRRLARERRHDGAEAGSVTFVQRYGSGLNLNPHYHAIGLDGWFHRDADDQLTFTRAPTPTQEDVESLLLDVHARALRLLARRGLLEADADDALARDAPALSACYEGAVTQRMGLGPMRGRPVMKLGTSLARHLASAYERVEGAGWLCARLDGFDLHGRVAFGAADRKRLSELVRYCARPPLAYDRLTKQADGRCLLRLKSRWRDGTTHLLFEPIELMERLAAQIPKPRVNLVLYAGVLAPHAKLRADAVVHARPEPLPEPPATDTQTRAERDTWSELMRLTFGLDVLQCPRCGGRLKHIATILDGRVRAASSSIWDVPPVRRLSLLRAIRCPSGTPWKQRPGTDARRRAGKSGPVRTGATSAQRRYRRNVRFLSLSTREPPYLAEHDVSCLRHRDIDGFDRAQLAGANRRRHRIARLDPR